MLDFVYNDGRRPPGIAPGYSDCTARAVALATGFTYQSVSAHLLARAHRRDFGEGFPLDHMRAALLHHNWRWRWARECPFVPLGKARVPPGRMVAIVELLHRSGAREKHATAVINEVAYDVFDPRGGIFIGYFPAPPRWRRT
jgi:hypothetical protein